MGDRRKIEGRNKESGRRKAVGGEGRKEHRRQRQRIEEKDRRGVVDKGQKRNWKS